MQTVVVASYSALGCISFGLGYFIRPTHFAGPLLGVTAVVCTLLGPSAWLVHGIAGIPLFLAATFLLVMAGILAMLFVG
jgi:hypothetical protein